MKQVSALVTEIVLNSDIKPWVDKRCAEVGAEVTWHNVTQSTANYKEVFKSSPNVITWQCRMPHSWTSSVGNNVLHVENSLLAQRSGSFVDSRGFFSQSSLCQDKHWSRSFNVDCEDFASKHLRAKAFSGGDKNGPVLFALQCRNDCNINFEFPIAPRGDRVEWVLDSIINMIPANTNLLIRPHPRERSLFEKHPARDRFTWSMDGDMNSLLPKCSSVITVNSTTASEACLLGIPTAVLGTGAFTGSGAVFECHKDFTRLLQFLSDPVADIASQKRYCEAILGAHFLPYKGTENASCSEFDRWLERLI